MARQTLLSVSRAPSRTSAFLNHIDREVIATFIAIVDAGSFTGAAMRMGKSQAAVSLTISRFEDRIGRKLFTRSRRGVSLTETGEVLIGYARRMIVLEDEALTAIHPEARESHVRLGMPDDYLEIFGQPLVEHFSQPETRLQVEIRCEFSHVLEAMVDTGDLDIAIITRAPHSHAGELLRREPLVWCGPASRYPERSDPLPLALFPEKDCRARPHVVAALNLAGRRWRTSWTSSHLPSILAALDAGAAVTALPASVISSRHRRLGEDEGLPPLRPLELAMLVPVGARIAVRKLATFLRARFQDL